jgi:uncharacterized membrane protein
MSRIIFTRLNLALMIAIVGVTLVGFWVLPADRQLPTHWNWYGAVDAWASRERALLLLPIFAAAMTLFFWVFGRWVAKVDELHGGRQYALGLSSSLTIFFLLQVLIVTHGLGYSVDVPRATAFVAALFFIVIGNVVPKMQPSARPFSWPKSLDAAEQHRLKRLTGGVMMASGLGLLIAGLFDMPPAWLNSATLFAALLPAAAGVTYGLLLSSAHVSNR